MHEKKVGRDAFMITMRNIIGLLRSPHIFHNSSFPIGRFTALNAVLLCMLASQCIFLFVPNTCYSQDQVVLFREEFDNLDNWKHVFLSKTKTPTKYSIEVNHEDHHLKAESNASASALLHQTEFNVYEYPNVRWQWMIMNVYQQGDTRTKTGDNSPLRIYVLFEYQPDTFDGFEKAIYDIAKLLHGEYPPYAALCYFWDNQPTDKKRISTSPNVDRVKMIVLQGGTGKIGTWQEEQINIVEDYLKAFGKKPPPMAKIGIMNDSDFTGERSISYLRFLEVYR